MTKARKNAQFTDATIYCTCHPQPGCTGQGHCVDNMQSAIVRRPNRGDMLRWLAAQG